MTAGYARRAPCRPAGVLQWPLVLLACAGALSAQTDAHKGRILGTVFDPAGASVASAEVRCVSDSTGIERTVQASEAGTFQLGGLDPGPYTLRASSSGFAEATVLGIVVSVGSAVTVEITLRIEASSEQIEVSASLIDSTQAAPDNIVNGTAIGNLPINGRRFHDFALLTPTVQVDRQRGQLSFVGQRGINANVMVDGTDYNQPFFGGIRGGERSNSIITVPQSAIREFQAVSAGYTAEYGRSSGGMLNVTTKSGSNDLHGDAFHQLRDRRWGVDDPFGAKSLETLRQTGGSLGGPLRRNKAFFFAALEFQQARTPRLVEFPRLAEVSRDAGAEAFDLYASLQEPFESTNDAWAFTPRTDFYLPNAQTLTFRYNASSATALNTSTTGDPRQSRTNRAVSNNGTEEDRIHYFTAQLASLLGPASINELRVTFSREERPRLNNADAPLIETAVGRFGSRFFLPTTQHDTRFQISDSVALTRGSHNWKLGLDINRLATSQNFGMHQFGRFMLFGTDPVAHLDCLSPGGAVANRFDCPGIYLRQIGNLMTSMDLGQYAAFAQDSWNPNERLTINFGLRWEAQRNPDPKATNTALLDRVLGADLPFGRTDPSVLPDSPNQLMPRFGFAFRPVADSHRTVVRGSFGVYYAATPLLLFADPFNNFRATPGNLSLALPTSAPTVYQQFLAAGIDLNQHALDAIPVFTPDEIRAVAGGATDPFLGAQPLTVADDYRNPRSVAFTAGIDRKVARGLVFGAEFHNVNTVHLQRNRDFNLPAPAVSGNDPAAIPFIDGRSRPIPSLRSLTVRESSARSLYRGLSVSAKYRSGTRLQWDAFYTWSRTYSDDDNERNAVGFTYTDPFDLRAEYGPSNQDIRHQFTSNAVARLPFGIGWSGIARVTSAAPINPLAGIDLNGDESPDGDRGLSAPGTYLGRNAYRNRPFANFDMRVMKDIQVSERAVLRFSAEIFNLFDLANVEYAGFNTVYGPGLDLSTGAVIGPQPTFMRLTDGAGEFDHNNRQIPGANPLQMQLGVRFEF